MSFLIPDAPPAAYVKKLESLEARSDALARDIIRISVSCHSMDNRLGLQAERLFEMGEDLKDIDATVNNLQRMLEAIAAKLGV